MTEPRVKRKLNVKMPTVTVAETVHPFQVAQPPPGVGHNNPPKEAALAMDWAGQGAVIMPYGYSAYGDNAGWLGYPVLAQMTQRAEYRRPAEILAKEMTREWIKLTSRAGKQAAATTPDAPKPGDPPEPDTDAIGEAVTKAVGAAPKPDKLALLKDAVEKFSLQKLFQQLVETEGYFGRAQLYIDIKGVEGDNLAKPLIVDPRQVGQGKLKGFTLVEPFWTYPANYNADKPLRNDFYQPQAWYVMGDTVHRSRMLTLVARPVPDILKPAYSFGGVSLSQLGKPYVDNWLRTRQSVSDLVHTFSTTVLKTNMSAELEEGCDSQSLTNRATMFNLFRDNKGLMLVDMDTEELVNVATPLSGLSDLQAQSQEQMASVFGIPLVILLGITPSGLNASSDGEIRVFYAWVKAQQEAHLSGLLRVALDLIQLNEFGEIDPDITFEWVPLWQVSEKEASDIRKQTIEGDTALIDAGVVDPAEVRAKIVASDDMGYDGVDLSGPPPEPVVPDMSDMPPGFGVGAEAKPAKPSEGFGGSET